MSERRPRRGTILHRGCSAPKYAVPGHWVNLNHISQIRPGWSLFRLETSGTSTEPQAGTPSRYCNRPFDPPALIPPL
ncbi:hypothetical protein VMCG_03297 [Cytospora schulzeri]|uniref:Uncharacterized protein n=1 Tax=Cytospora schulzeri TaxID=448051 RepID=A0A423WY15_9PEZI|nr:hypothetical protein VMCG_03297 [Valsa malicola]